MSDVSDVTLSSDDSPPGPFREPVSAIELDSEEEEGFDPGASDAALWASVRVGFDANHLGTRGCLCAAI